MYVKLGGNSKIAEKDIYSDWALVYSIPRSRKGNQEIIFVINADTPPGMKEEPDLYKDAIINNTNPLEIHLTYKENPLLEIIITTGNEDQKFRREHPDIIYENVLFEVYNPKI